MANSMAHSKSSSKNFAVLDVAYVVVFAALIIVFGFIAIPVGSAGVPLVIQNSIILLGGLVLGGKRGALAAGLVLLLGMFNLPVLAGGRSTLSAIAGPTVGYLVGYVVSVFVAGTIAYLARPRHRLEQLILFTLAAVAGLLTQYACGVPGLMWRTELSLSEAVLAQLPFILPGLLESSFMVAIALAIHAAFPDLLAKSTAKAHPRLKPPGIDLESTYPGIPHKGALMSRSSKVVDLAYIVVFAALVIVFAFVSIPAGTIGVPIVLQNAVIMLAGLILGGTRGALAAGLVLLLGMFNLPVLAGGRSTLAAIAGPTVGYLVGYVFSALFAGMISYRARPRRRKEQAVLFSIAALVGLFTQYAFGILGVMWRVELSLGEAIISQSPYIIPDLIKFALMVVIALAVHAAFPDLLGSKRHASNQV